MDFDETAEQLEAIADDAPDEIEDAMSVLAEGYAEIAEVFQDIDFSDPQSFQDPETQAADRRSSRTSRDEEYEAAGRRGQRPGSTENCTGVAGD